MEALSAYTREGPIMSVDTRLRPHGKSGDLVTTPAQLQTYFVKDAQGWEALTYLKARCVAGPEDTRNASESAIAALVARFQKDPGFGVELRAMRARLEKSEPAPNLKLGPGGAYDIDFITGYLLIRAGEPLAAENQLERIMRLKNLGAIGTEQAETLRRAAELFRTVEHAVRLVEGRARKWIPANPIALRSVEAIVTGVLGREIDGSLAEELQSNMTAVRSIFDVTFKH
jgi:glutamate-ammonia-ligase adenylyltransferase